MASTVVTTFLIPNLHCPSCCTFVEEALGDLQLPPHSVSTSIISHTVTVKHTAALSIETLSTALDEAGFEVVDVFHGPLTVAHGASNQISTNKHGIPPTGFEETMQRWIPGPRPSDDAKRLKHIANCVLCQTQLAAAPAELDLPGNGDNKEAEEIGVVVTQATTLELLKASLAVDGMTCSSCVGSVTHALEELSWVRSAAVNLITNSATVVFEGENHCDEVVKAVEDAGFGASIQHVEKLGPDRLDSARHSPAIWEASFAIEGMTCSSCVNGISSLLKGLAWIETVNVNLLTNSASVKFTGDGQERAEEIVASIADAGFVAKLDRLDNLAAQSTLQAQRHVFIKVDGMYCEHCPPKILTALRLLSDDIEIENLPSIKDPILKIGYTPEAPKLTVRHILRAISDADVDFEPTIYKPVSLEERSKLVQKREQWHMLYRFALALAAAIPSLIIGIVYMSLVPPTNPGRLYLEERLHGITRAEISLFVISTFVYFFAADIFHRRTFKELRALWRPGSRVPLARRFYRFGSMNMLISFGTTIAYLASIAQLAVAASYPNTDDPDMEETYFDSVVFLTMFLLLGRLIEAYSKAKTGNAVAELGKLRPSHAMLVTDGCEESISTDLLDVGDIVRVPQGGSPPFDGLVVDGHALNFDESSLTGESRLVSKSIGDDVFSGTINKGNSASVRLTKVSGNSMLDQIINIVREGQARRAPVERVADAITGYFVPFVTLVAVLTWVIWMTLGISGVLPKEYLNSAVGGWPFWSLKFAIAVFVVACPCGIGLASPTALFVGGGLAAKHGILVKGGGEAFQEASGLDCVVFDKTGTLTEGGEPRVTDHEIIDVSGMSLEDADLLGVVLATEAQSTHPIAKSLVSFCRDLAAATIRVGDTSEIPGKGMFAQAKLGKDQAIEIVAGNESLMKDYGVTIPVSIADTLEGWKSQGKSIALVGIRSEDRNWQLALTFAISDPPRPEARHVVESLQRADIDVWMLSGDNSSTAYAVGAQVGIPRANIIAGVLPSQKAEKIKYLQQSLTKKLTWGTVRKIFSRRNATHKYKRATVAMVGDGINDSPALTIADVGIAIGSGSDVAISSAAFVLVSSDLTSLLTLIHLSRAVFRRIKLNFGWALVYNCLALPIAAGALYPVKSSSGTHIRLDPVWASLAMALSSISVVCSSLLLRSKLPWVGFRVKRWEHGRE